MATLNPYLNFDGNTEEVFTFYKSVFGGEFVMLQRFKDMPAHIPSPESDGEKVMHVALPIGKGSILMGCDRPQAFGQGTKGDNFNISIAADSKESAKLFHALAAGGTVLMPLEDAFWGAYFGMCRDKFGIQWMVSYHSDQNSNNEPV